MVGEPLIKTLWPIVPAAKSLSAVSTTAAAVLSAVEMSSVTLMAPLTVEMAIGPVVSMAPKFMSLFSTMVTFLPDVMDRVLPLLLEKSLLGLLRVMLLVAGAVKTVEPLTFQAPAAVAASDWAMAPAAFRLRFPCTVIPCREMPPAVWVTVMSPVTRVVVVSDTPFWMVSVGLADWFRRVRSTSLLE